MKPAPFDYYAPRSKEEALSLLTEHGFDGKILAGGQSLIPVMNFRLSQPAVLIDLNTLPNMGNLQPTHDGGLLIGAMTRHAALENSTLLAQHAPLMHQAMPYIAHPQIRNRGTIGGSIAHADPAGELPVICVALDAQFRLEKAGGDRWVTADSFFIGLFETELAPEEMITEVKLPPMPSKTGYAFQELARRHGDYAQAGVAAVVTVDDNGRCQNARLVFLNVGERPMIARQAPDILSGEKWSEALVETAVATAVENEIEPSTDVHATAAYKRHLAGVLARRALHQAYQNAQERSA